MEVKKEKNAITFQNLVNKQASLFKKGFSPSVLSSKITRVKKTFIFTAEVSSVHKGAINHTPKF